MESVERDAYGEYHFQQQAVRGDVEQLGKLRDEEVVILEKSQDAEVEDDVQPHPCLGLFLVLGFPYQQSATPRAERGEGDEQQEAPIPPAVEHVTCDHHESVLQAQLPLRLADESVEDEPIEQEYYRQEYRELDGVKEHNALFSVAKIKKISM